MPDILKTWILLWALTCGLLQSCAKEDETQTQKPSESAAKNNTNICGADWEGDRGDLVFPGLVTYEECENLCEPIYEQLVEDNGSGYCQFGSERVWEYPYYVDQ